jgi:hypothetical protein
LRLTTRAPSVVALAIVEIGGHHAPRRKFLRLRNRRGPLDRRRGKRDLLAVAHRGEPCRLPDRQIQQGQVHERHLFREFRVDGHAVDLREQIACLEPRGVCRRLIGHP